MFSSGLGKLEWGKDYACTPSLLQNVLPVEYLVSSQIKANNGNHAKEKEHCAIPFK